MKKYASLIFFAITSMLYAAWTWILTAPNLVLSTQPLYWQVQTWLWEHYYANRPLVTYLYIAIVTLFLVAWWRVVKFFRHTTIDKRKFLRLFSFSVVPLLFSYNALSYDVFNYLFNAKMVAVYHANPHIQTATDFPADDWTRFMHNVHTPAPYGYGATALTLIPYFAGAGKFLPSWLLLRFYNLVFVYLLLWLVCRLQKRCSGKFDAGALALVFFNPLFLIEMIGNMHNDLWMMVPALAALYLLYPSDRPKRWHHFVGAAILYGLSLSVKYATLALAPVILFLAVQNFAKAKKFLENKWGEKLMLYWADIAAGLMFLPLLLSRSQRFHPWYLVWMLTFIPLTKSRLVRRSSVILSAASLYRYVPYLWENGYSEWTLVYQQIISLAPVTVYWLAVSSKKLLGTFGARKNG